MVQNAQHHHEQFLIIAGEKEVPYRKWKLGIETADWLRVLSVLVAEFD